jgi:hypothetical protein
MKEYKRVTKEEFDIFIAEYPRKLERDVSGISDPPTLTMNDFSIGVWPDSVVAKADLYETFPKDRMGQVYGWEPNKYFIKELDAAPLSGTTKE